jgi:hypothetical protein
MHNVPDRCITRISKTYVPKDQHSQGSFSHARETSKRKKKRNKKEARG